MRITLISNSQGTSAGVSPKENYPVLLRELLGKEHKLHVFAINNWSIKDFNEHIDIILTSDPQLVISQIGIIECARRILSNGEKKFFYWLPGGRYITLYLHRHRKSIIYLRKRLGINAYRISTKEFKIELEILKSTLSQNDIDFLFIEIPRFSLEYEKEYYPYINEDIDTYNAIARGFNSMPLFREDDDLYGIWQPGTVHFNAKGHIIVAQKLAEVVREKIGKPSNFHEIRSFQDYDRVL